MAGHGNEQPGKAKRSGSDRRTVVRWGGAGLLAALGARYDLSAVGMPATAAPAGRTRFGVNCYDLYANAFSSTRPADPLARLRRLRDAGITLVRFSASPFWASDWTRFLADRPRFLGYLDQLFDAADALDIRLIPTVIWAPFGLSDRLQEPYSAWGDPQSVTRRFFDRYVREIVGRYRQRRSLLIWECANEMNSYVDLPGGERFFPPVRIANATPARRGAADRISAEAVQSTYQAFVELVRRTGDTHPISSGSDTPRFNQLAGARGRFDADDRPSLEQALAESLAGGANVLSIHLYATTLRNRGTALVNSAADLLSVARRVASANQAQLLIGEFGVPRSPIEPVDRAAFAAMLAAIRESGADYAALWNYDFAVQREWNVTFDNDRAWMLDALVAANA